MNIIIWVYYQTPGERACKICDQEFINNDNTNIIMNLIVLMAYRNLAQWNKIKSQRHNIILIKKEEMNKKKRQDWSKLQEPYFPELILSIT